jgi:acyl dehydratase
MLPEDDPMADLYFDDVSIGTIRTSEPYLVTKDEIIQFARQYDPAPRHLDEEAAARSVFGGLAASSAHTFSLFILLASRLRPRLRVLAGLAWDELRLPNAVRPGDELDLEATILDMRQSKSKSDRGIIRNRIFLRNRRREAVLECIATILVARRPDANAPAPH